MGDSSLSKILNTVKCDPFDALVGTTTVHRKSRAPHPDLGWRGDERLIGSESLSFGGNSGDFLYQKY
ncbi:hypothetical protein CH376_16285 [Leptospira adleri]|uniref:Uncharacterized protein n=1 Tax=Leptospira adleri TaxID=2023186 RepID=A0ABX4NYE4_9LEPT|nr:hypothetical protein CH376_16285 [Leptospira adleri]